MHARHLLIVICDCVHIENTQNEVRYWWTIRTGMSRTKMYGEWGPKSWTKRLLIFGVL